MTWTTQPRSEGPGGLHYWAKGQGPALVLIHGVGLRAEAWGAMVPLLTPHFTVYAVDMPGHGASPLDGATRLADYSTRFAQLIEGMDGAVAIAGHSMGAMIALDLAITHPKSVRSIAALNAIFERTPDATQAVQARAAALRDSGPNDPTPTLQRWFSTAPSGAHLAASQACQAWLTTADADGYSNAYSVFARHDGPSRTALSTLDTPALFLTGVGDPNSTPEMSRAMSTLAPQGCANIIPDAAHMAPMTHPHAIANALINHAQKAKP